MNLAQYPFRRAARHRSLSDEFRLATTTARNVPHGLVTLSFRSIDWGGETKVNGVRQNDRKNQGRWRVGGALSLDCANQFQLEFGTDTSVENGYREKEQDRPAVFPAVLNEPCRRYTVGIIE